MKKLLSALLLLLPMAAMAQESQKVTLVRDGKQFNVSMDVTLDRETVQYTHAYILTPVLVGEQDSLALKPVGYYSKDKFYHFLPEAGVASSQSFSKDALPVVVKYQDSVPFQKWMNNCTLKLVHQYEGCCGDSGEMTDELARHEQDPWVFEPHFIYVTEAEEVTKTREKSNQGKFTFPVNSTKLNPNYLRNAISLGIIERDINLVKEDPDYTIQKIELQSAASPEGRFSVNQKLAEGRVIAIRDYVKEKTEIADEAFETNVVPEDWAGLREYIADSNLADKDELLAIVDSDADPDVKEQKLRAHAASWKTIKNDCLPELRRTTYKISYVIRAFTDPKEIMKEIRENPEDVSVKEYHTALASLEPESKDFKWVCKNALAQYPEDPSTNLNAANLAMKEGDLEGAAALLAKAGDSAEAEWARAMCLCLDGQFEAAVPHAQAAAKGGIEEANQLLEDIEFNL